MSKISQLLSSLLFPQRRPKVSAAYQRVLDPPPKGPPAHRLRAAVRARPAESSDVALNDNAVGGAPNSNGAGPDQSFSAKRTESTR